MRTQREIFVTTKWLLLTALCAPLAACHEPAGPELGATPTQRHTTMAANARGGSVDAILRDRRALAESGRYLLDPGAGFGAAVATAEQLAAAIDVPPAFLRGVSLEGPDIATSVFEQWGVIRPRRGGSFAVLSTGVVDTIPEPGTDLSPGGEDGDRVALRLELAIPAGTSRLSFDYNFLSSESPDFVGSIYNDTFTATLIDAGGTAHPIAIGPDGVLASVNSSVFFDASAERAGGTKFDIFTADTAGVDDEFPGGLPDAGITDFQTVNIELPATGDVTLVFDIRDQGDGVLDSAVIIDNLRFSFLETVQLNPLPAPQPALVAGDGSVVTEPAVLVQAKQHVRGVVADGVTQVLLRTRVPAAGEVEFSLAGGSAPADGRIGALDASDPGDRFTARAVPAGGALYAFAAYTAPKDFNRGFDDALGARTVTVRARFVSDDGQTVLEDTHELEIRRPPVVLVHGLWDDPLAWRMPILDDPRFAVHHASYDSVIHLADNAPGVPSLAIRDARLALQNQHIAATQVDVVAHGIGGILARMHLDRANYRNGDNFGRGDVHKLITINTPHLGTNLANQAMAMWGSLTDQEKGFMANVLVKSPIHHGAMEDIQIGQPLFDALEASQVPSHALIGAGGRFIPRGEPNAQGQIVDSPALTSVEIHRNLYLMLEQRHPAVRGGAPEAKLGFVFGESSLVFAGDHDMFSELDSQAGGLPAVATSSFLSYHEDDEHDYQSLHYPAPTSAAYSSRIVELLDTSVDSTAFGSFPAPRSLMAGAALETPVVAAEPVARVQAVEPHGLRILSPVDGTQVTPGTSIEVAVTPDPGVQLELLGVMAATSSVIVDRPAPGQSPLLVQLPIPADASGAIELLAFGFDASGELLISNSVQLGVALEVELVSVRILDRNPFLFGAGDVRQVRVVGLYSDGIERDITLSAAGTEYLSSSPAVFEVQGDGYIVSRGAGRATLVARNRLVQDSVTVEVRPNAPPVADAGPDIVRECLVPGQEVEIALDGTGSFDPEGAQLAFAWFEGSAQISEQAAPTLRFTAGAQHNLSLIVSDGQSSSDPDTVLVSLLADTAPPVVTCPGDPLTIEATPGRGGAYVSYEATAVDACDGSVAAACDIPSGSFFAMNQSTAVTCAATDALGNTGACTFSVQVLEPSVCDPANPRGQDYWRTQCNYPGPGGEPPDPLLTAEMLQALVAAVAPDLQATCDATETACDALNPEPYYDACEQACQHYAGLLLNIASGRLPPSCCVLDGSATEAAMLVADRIAAGECQQAIGLADELNRGCHICAGEP